MAKQKIIFPFVNGRQIFTMPYGYDSNITYHCWGAGGGAGGDSNDQLGGNGSAGSYTTGSFIANPGDEIEVVVGGGGQEGRSLESTKKIYSLTIPGAGSGGVGPTATYGWVTDPIQAIYPRYNDPLPVRTYGNWNSFMNTWAVSDLPANRPGTEEVNNNIYFPEAGGYTLQVSCDNSIVVNFQGKTYTSANTFGNGPTEYGISVPAAGVYELNYVLTNAASSSNNPAGAAIVITRGTPGYMGGGDVKTYSAGVSMKNIVWSTRMGRNVDVTNAAPVIYAPLVPFYQPQRDNYGWGGFDNNRSMAFVSATTTLTDSDLALLNLNFNTVISIGYPVTITGQGNVDQVVSSGYYTFKRGQTWKLATYDWTGNPFSNNNVSHGSGTPSNWTERQWYNDNTSGRSRNVVFAKWDLPVPPDDAVYIVGYGDGVIYNAPSQRGSDNLTWTVNSTQGQSWAGGQGGASVKNVSNKKYNYYGGWGGQIGSGQTSGGGGGGGGASAIFLRTPNTSALTGVTIAGGGAGGGGAGFRNYGGDGQSDYQSATTYPNSVGAGIYGISNFNSGGGGGGGGGGCDGGQAGNAANQGGGLGSGGEGAWSGGSQAVVTNLYFPPADFVMIGRGGDGGGGGGGGGAGELVTGRVSLTKAQFIQVGGAGEERMEGSVSAIWWSETNYIVAGSGGRGGSLGAAWGRNGNGQSGGCVSGDTGTPAWGGSGGGGGTNPQLASASGGAGKAMPKKPSSVSNEYYTSGGGCGSGAGGGGGGAGSGGQSGGTNYRGGNGGDGRTITLGGSGKTYRLGGGGGGSAPNNHPGPYIGMGRDGGGDGDTGSGPMLEFLEVSKTYTVYVPRNTTTMYVQGIAGGGSGGNGGAQGSGGGGSGGYLPRTSYTVTPGQRIDVTVGKGGVSGAGGTTTIKFYATDTQSENIISLTGGHQGQAPLGGVGGSPNGQQGNSAADGWSGTGANSALGSGGGGCEVSNKTSKPGNADGYGAGGGGGAPGRNGGLGSNGYVRIDWTGGTTQNALPNTGSGGGGGFDGGGGSGGSGFVAIAYAGPPMFTFRTSGNRVIAPVQQNGYTIHECRESGYLIFQADLPAGRIERGSGVNPPATGVSGYVPGTGAGGFGHDSTSVYPVTASAYPTFLREHGVWNSDPTSTTFNRTYWVQFPATARYTFQAYADNGAQVWVDDGLVVDMTPANRDGGSYWYKNGLTVEQKVASGLHKITISATNLSTAGAFGMTIVQTYTPSIKVFDSRFPPVTGGSPQGGAGLVILEMTGVEGTSKVKVNNTWYQIKGDWIKVAGSWQPVKQAWVKIQGVWQGLFGGPGVQVTINTADFGPGPTPATPTSAVTVSTGGGGGGGCCVISTAFADQGIWKSQQKDDLIAWCERWLHGSALGECFRRGYQVLGSAVVLGMRRQDRPGRIWTKYATWAFNHGTNMVRGRKFSWISVPNTVIWIAAFMLVGAVVSTNTAKRCWRRLY